MNSNITGILSGLLLVLDLLLVLVRTSLVNARPARLMILRESRPAQVDRTLNLLENNRLRLALRLAQMSLHVLLGVGLYLFIGWVLPLPIHWLGRAGILVALTLLLLLAEFALEAAVLQNPDAAALRFTGLGRVVNFCMTPLTVALIQLTAYPLQKTGTINAFTDDELRTWAEGDQPEGSLEVGERKMIASIFQFGETLAREVMVPRIDMLALEVNTSLAEAVQEFSRSGHSRLPVFEDTVDNIIGLLYAKDLLPALANGQQEVTLRKFLRPVYFIPEAKKVDDLLAEMQTRSIHMAVVVDEYGGVAGLVTLEDIVEEIIGEIRDEYDQAEEMLFQPVDENEILFQGRIDLDDFNDVMGTHLTKEVADTLGGYMYGEMGRIPAEGESVQTEDVVLTVEQVLGRRIRKVRARRLPPVEEGEKTADADRNGS